MRGKGLSKAEIEKARLRGIGKRTTFSDIVENEKVQKFSRFLEKIHEKEKRYSETLTCINNEWEMIAYAYCMDFSPRSAGEIFRRFREIVHPEITFQSSRTSTFTSYLDRKFVKYGFAYTHQINGNRCWGQSETKKDLLPVIAFALKYSLKRGKSMNSFLGDYSGQSGYGPYNRAKLLIRLLDEKTPCTKTDLCKDIPAWANLPHHIYPLKQEGFIDFDSYSTKEYWFNTRNGAAFRALPDGKLKKRISALVKSKGRVGINEVHAEIGCDPCYVSTLITQLTLDEILCCDFVSNEKSKVALLPEGEHAARMLRRIRGAVYGEPLYVKLPSIADAREAAALYLPYTRGNKRMAAQAARQNL